MTNKKTKFIESIAPNLFQVGVLILAVAAAFYIGKLSTQVKYFEESANLGAAPTGAVDPSAAPAPQPENLSALELVTDGDHIRGSESAKIAIIEYSDYDCPFCGTFHETAKEVVEEYAGEVMWIYRHFPLDGLHPEARAKAIAAECAAAVGGEEAFWSFSDELFTTQVTAADMITVAEKLGIDSAKFASCYNDENTAVAVDYDISTASDVGVQGTPGNYVVNLETESVIPLRGAEPIQNVRDVISQLQ